MKIKCTIFILAIFVLCFSFTVFASDTNPTIIVGEVEATEEDTIRVPVSIDNNTGICGAILYINCDEGLELNSITIGDALSTLKMTKPGDLSINPVKILWDGTEADDSNGDIAYLIFKKPEKEGVYSIEVSYKSQEVFDGELNPVNIELKNGSVTVGRTDIVTIPITIKRRTANVTFDPDRANEDVFFSMNRTNTKATLKKLTKRGYTFKDWRLNGRKIKALYEKNLKQDITLTARFVPNTYYVYYKVPKPKRNARIKGDRKTVKVKYTDEAFTLKGIDITLDGYTFKGWTTDKNSNTVMYEPGEVVKIDALLPERGKKIYLYAVWEMD